MNASSSAWPLSTAAIARCCRHTLLVGDVVSLEAGDKVPADGLLLAGIAVASEPRGSANWRSAIWFGEQLFAGWRRMCEISKNSCQDDPRLRCGGRRNRAACR